MRGAAYTPCAVSQAASEPSRRRSLASRPPEDPQAALAAFTVPNAAQEIWKMIERDLKEPGVKHETAPYGPRLVEKERCAYLRPWVIRVGVTAGF